jgi:tetratricopeptide (TPR) repeat protein/predicted aspartyl protease
MQRFAALRVSEGGRRFGASFRILIDTIGTVAENAAAEIYTMREEMRLVMMVTVCAVAGYGIARPAVAGVGKPNANGAQSEKQSQSAPPTSQTPAAPSGKIFCPVNAETDPPLSEPLLNAQTLYRTGKFDEAVTAYNAIVPQGGKEAAAAYAGLARVYLKEKRPDDAYEAAMKAVAITPGRAPAVVALGEVYYRQGKLPEAEQLFLKPLQACNLDARAYLGLTRLYRVTLNFKRAKTNIDQAFKLDPGDPDIRRAYLGTLSGAERVKFLKDYLAGLTDDDAEARTAMERQLAVLEGESKFEQHNCRLTTKVGKTETRLEQLLYDAQHIRGYGLVVKVNGTSSRLLLDTGASGILIDQRIAEKAGVKHVVDNQIRGIGDKGAAAGYLGYADKIQIGQLEFEGCYVDVMAGRSVLDNDGLIGADVFDHFLVDMDMPDAKFKLSELPPIPDEPATETTLTSKAVGERHWHDRYIAPEMKDYSRIFLFGHDMLIPTRINKLPAKLFLIDTGSFDDTLSPAAAREATKISQDTDTRIKGLSGNVKTVYRANEVTLQFSHFQEKREDLVTFDLTNISNAEGTEISGVLGFAVLRLLDMKIDYRDGLVDFTYDPNRLH